MNGEQLKKLIATAILLIIIDRIEFAYYPFEGVKKMVSFVCCHEPITISWWVYLVTIQVQYLLFTVILYIWIPQVMKREMLYIVIAFALCVIELPITYGRPIAQLPLPWQWYFPLSCSLLRLISIMWFLTVLVMKIIKHETD
jgi:hypothetical protein